jgi:hypothetical protein
VSRKSITIFYVITPFVLPGEKTEYYESELSKEVTFPVSELPQISNDLSGAEKTKVLLAMVLKKIGKQLVEQESIEIVGYKVQ